MGCRVDLFLRKSEGQVAQPLGATEVTPVPVPAGAITFMHRGRTTYGRVELVAPADWQAKREVPTVIAVQLPLG